VIDYTRVKPRRFYTIEGKVVSFKCKAEVFMYWKFNNGNLPRNALSYHSIQDNTHRLEIRALTILNQGEYSCFGELQNYMAFESKGVLIINGEYIVYSEFVVKPYIL